MEEYPPSPCCTLAAAALTTPTVVAAAVVVCLFVAAKVTAAACVALVAAPAVFDVSAAEFPADAASTVVATFHPASAVDVTAVASIPVGHLAWEERLQIFALSSSPSAINWGKVRIVWFHCFQ